MESPEPEEFSQAWFDKSSELWRANKKPIGQGSFAYTCTYVHKNGKVCKKDVPYRKIDSMKCKQHCGKRSKESDRGMSWMNI